MERPAIRLTFYPCWASVGDTTEVSRRVDVAAAVDFAVSFSSEVVVMWCMYVCRWCGVVWCDRGVIEVYCRRADGNQMAGVWFGLVGS
jgi:hypothetical protein